MRTAAILLLLLPMLAACTKRMQFLKEGDPIPEGKGVLVGTMEFTGFGIDRELVLRTEAGTLVRVRQMKSDLFVCALEPGTYRYDYLYLYRWQDDPPQSITIRPGEVTYIGAWKAVLGPNIDLQDGWEKLGPEMERRFPEAKKTKQIPGGPRRIKLEFDPSLNIIGPT